VEGRLPDYSKERNEDVLISQYLANRLRFKLGDSFTALFRKDDPNKPPSMITYNIVGIYSSGFKDFDETYVLGDLRHLQRLNQWESNEAGHFEVFVTDYSKLNQTFNQVYQNTPSLLNVVTLDQNFCQKYLCHYWYYDLGSRNQHDNRFIGFSSGTYTNDRHSKSPWF